MPGTPVLIGPFSGGLNTYSESTQIDDSEAVELTNFDIDLDGSLVSRPPCNTMPSTVGNGGILLGTYTTTTGTLYYIIIDNANNLKAYDVVSGSAVFTISTNIECRCVVQYQNKLWVIATPNSANPGGTWDPVSGFTAVAAIARGSSATIYQERLFIAMGSQSTTSARINFSAAGNFSSFTLGTDFFDVNNGDGQAIVKIVTFGGRIIVFKLRSTWTFAYDASPSKGKSEIVAANVGIAGPNCYAEFEGTIYVLYGNTLYGVINWNWSPINVKVPFVVFNSVARTTNNNFSVSLLGNRVITRFYDNFYVYNMRTRAFSLWRFSTVDFTPDYWIQYPVVDPTTNAYMYVAGGYDNGKTAWYRMVDFPTYSVGETFTCSLVTKTYDYKVPYTFKRMFWWGVDILSKTQVTFNVHPTAYNIPIKWSQISNGVTKWSQVGTWAKPLNLSIDVTDSVNTANPSGTRMFMKLLKGLRFRQISFKVSTTVNGTLATAPLKIFSLTAITSSKALVSEKIS